jgi:hypothetical protein
MALTEAQILDCAGHDDLLELLFAELKVRLPPSEPFHMGPFLKKIRTIPIGLRAMAATFELDVSMALDDLGWHFGNGPIAAIATKRCAGCANWKRGNTRTCSLRRTRWLRRAGPSLPRVRVISKNGTTNPIFTKRQSRCRRGGGTCRRSTVAFSVVGPDMPANIPTRSHRSWRHSEPSLPDLIRQSMRPTSQHGPPGQARR